MYMVGDTVQFQTAAEQQPSKCLLREQVKRKGFQDALTTTEAIVNSKKNVKINTLKKSVITLTVMKIIVKRDIQTPVISAPGVI